MKLQSLLLGLPSTTLALSPLDTTWDYIIVGSGASGIPLADRLSENGASVLLLERGFATSGRWGGTWQTEWLKGTNLTRFDVPALAQTVWDPLIDNTGVFCADYQFSAGCNLGGGTAVNAGLFYMPTPEDLDRTQPPGFKWDDCQAAYKRTEERIPWTDTPSQDGKPYLTNATDIGWDALLNASPPYRAIKANEDSDRNRVASLAPYMFIGGERGGVMATYLVTASERENFHLQMNTTVTRVLRDGDTATGVEVEASGSDGVSGTIKLTPGTGRVILSAGVFGSFKVLLRSGIGPADQLERLTNHTTESFKLPAKKDWIDLPVGHNADDSAGIPLAVMVPYLEDYDWRGLWTATAESRPEIKQYLEDRSGPVALLQRAFGPVAFDTITGDDGIDRVIQWDIVSETGLGVGLPGGYIIGAAFSLDLGKTARGKLELLPNDALTVNVTESPFFTDEGGHDFAAVVKSASGILEVLKSIPDSTVVYPPPNTTLAEFFAGYAASGQPLTRNHWTGSTHMSESCDDKMAVIDTSTRVCGMKNLHVVDAGSFNGVPGANPQATFVVMAERASEVILALSKKG